MTQMDKDRLAAFVDGELSPEDAARVVMHLADHPEDQAYVDDLFAANAALAAAFSGPLTEPVPAAIHAAILGGVAVLPDAPPSNVVAFPPRRVMAWAGLAVAASVAMFVVLGPALVPQGGASGVVLGPLAAADPVAEVLDSRNAGEPVTFTDGRETMVLASFALPDGRFCREFEVIDLGAGRIDYAVGCRAATGWAIEAVIAEAVDGQADDSFVPAEGAEAETLTRFLARHGTPVPLDADAEAAAIREDWLQ